MPTPIHRRNHGVHIVHFLRDSGLPRIEGGSASASNCFEACSAFTRVSACMLVKSPKGDPLHRSTSADSSPPPPPRLLPAGTTVDGWDSHPLKIAAFTRHTSKISLASFAMRLFLLFWRRFIFTVSTKVRYFILHHPGCQVPTDQDSVQKVSRCLFSLCFLVGS